MHRVFADENIPGLEKLLAPGTHLRRGNGRDLVNDDLAEIDILFVRSVTRVTRELLAGTPVRFVGSATSGLDHVDLPYLQAQGIGFAHAPGANANSVVEYLLCAIAAVEDMLERLLAGGSVGVVGYGHIGRAVQARLQSLGIHNRVYDPWLATATLPNPCESLEELLTCDVIALHPELTDALPGPSRHLLGAGELAALGTGQLLVNASRGPVVDNAALSARLQAGSAPAVVLDVWEGEPVIDPVLLDRVRIGTAHIAGYSLPGKLMATSMLCHAAARATGLVLAAASPEDTTGVLAAGDSLDGAALVRSLLRATYAIQDDDAALRAALEGAGPQALGERFDRLRRDYPERGELKGRSVRCSFRQRPWIEALGCRPIMTGESG